MIDNVRNISRRPLVETILADSLYLTHFQGIPLVLSILVELRSIDFTLLNDVSNQMLPSASSTTTSCVIIWTVAMEMISHPFPTDGQVYYLPHHGVTKLGSEMTKLRVVFDASAKCANGLALNQTLWSSPKLQQDI